MAITLQLFNEPVSCNQCRHSWTAMLHGFSRGHTVLAKNAAIAFLPDDLGYAFLTQIDAVVSQTDPSNRIGDPADLLIAMGWKDVQRCPNCGAKDYSAKYEQRTLTPILSMEFTSDDFAIVHGEWELTDSGRAKAEGK